MSITHQFRDVSTAKTPPSFKNIAICRSQIILKGPKLHQAFMSWTIPRFLFKNGSTQFNRISWANKLTTSVVGCLRHDYFVSFILSSIF
jgi:hypothetical protein